MPSITLGGAGLARGPVQLRGRLRWKWRRWRAALRHGSAELGTMPIVFGNAMPKAGSKLLFNVLRGLQEIGPFVDTGLGEIKPYRDGLPTSPGWIDRQLSDLRPGDIRLGYLPWTPEIQARLCQDGWAVFLILRDPRDTIVSQIFYATTMHGGHALRDYLGSLPDMEARVSTMICGIPDGPLKRVDVRRQYERFLPWLTRPEICPVRFERLVSEPDETLAGMMGYLRRRGFNSTQSDDVIVPRLKAWMAPGKSETFRRGTVGGWKDHFTDRNREEFARVGGDLLQVLGYDA